MLFESLLAMPLSYPTVLRYVPSGIHDMIQEIYQLGVRKIIQYEDACSRYDEKLGYILKTGSCVFKNQEFENEFRINALGARDDDESLFKPEVIVLGDSYAMGWGVEQEETFAQVIEQRTHLKVLNLSVSSYGTVREMILLNRADVSNLKYLIIQYHPNDYKENKNFYDQGNRWAGIKYEKYEQHKFRYQKFKQYYPFKFLLISLKMIKAGVTDRANQLLNQPSRTVPRENEAGVFLNAVNYYAHFNRETVKVIVFKVGQEEKAPDDFISLLKTEIALKRIFFANHLYAYDMSNNLNSSAYYYLLDEHLNAKGHQVVGETLSHLLMSESL